MSEKLHAGHEKHESLDLSKEIGDQLHEHVEKAEQSQNEHQLKLEQIHRSIEQQAISGQEVRLGQAERTTAEDDFYANQQLKAGAFTRTLKTARKHLTKPEKAFSKAVHQPTVETVSRIGEKTVARPAGILGGSAVALVGSAILLYIAKHYGYHYNFAVFFVLFIGGYVVGMILELLVKLLFRSHHTQ